MLQLIKDDMQDSRSLESIRVEVLIGTNYKACVSLCAWMSDSVSIILFSGTLACSRVAKVSVCPQALRALREQSLAFSHEKRQALHQKAAWPTDDQDQVFPFVFFHIFALLSASTVSATKVRCNPGFHLTYSQEYAALLVRGRRVIRNMCYILPLLQSCAIEDTLETSFKLVVQHMEEYLSLLLSQLNFSFSRCGSTDTLPH